MKHSQQIILFIYIYIFTKRTVTLSKIFVKVTTLRLILNPRHQPEFRALHLTTLMDLDTEIHPVTIQFTITLHIPTILNFVSDILNTKSQINPIILHMHTHVKIENTNSISVLTVICSGSVIRWYKIHHHITAPTISALKSVNLLAFAGEARYAHL